MKKIRKGILILLVISLLAAIAPVSAALNQKEGIYTYQIKDGEAIFIHADKSSEPLIIPDTLGGYPVTEIAALAFRHNTTEPYLVIPEGIKRIDPQAFYSLPIKTVYILCNDVEYNGNPLAVDNLYVHEDTYIKTNVPHLSPQGQNRELFYLEDYPCLPTELTPIEEGDWCYAISNGEAILLSTDKTGEFTVPDTLGGAPVTYIAPFCFKGDELRVTLPDSVKSIGTKAFTKSPNGKRFLTKLPANLKRISGWGIRGCELEDYTLPDTLESICERAFWQAKVDKLSIPGSVTYIGEYAFYESEMREVIIGDGTQYIGASAFAACENLTKITIPGSVTQCEDCLSKINYQGYRAVVYGDLDSAAYDYCGRKGIVFVDRSSGITYAAPHTTILDGIEYTVYPNRYCVLFSLTEGYAKDIVIPDTVEGVLVVEISTWAFLEGTMETVTLPDTITTIGEGAFHSCPNLSWIEMPDALEIIGDYCFCDCPKLLCVCLPDSMTSIGDDLTDRNTAFFLVSSSEYVQQAAKKYYYTCIPVEPDTVIVAGNNAVCKVVDGEAILLALNENTEDRVLYVPDEVQGYPVVGIAGSAVYDYYDCREMVLGKNVRYIEQGALDSVSILSLYTTETLESLPENVVKPTGVIYGYEGSYAQTYARENHFAFSILVYMHFTDVPEEKWYYPYVYACYCSDLMQGTSETTFSPDNTTNRAMLVTMLWRMFGCPESTGKNPFKDVENGKWYTDAVLWASECGIVNGTDATHFAPTKTITREQTAAILYRTAGLLGINPQTSGNLNAFVDGTKTSNFAKDAMRWAVGTGMIQGNTKQMLKPQGNTTRAEMATILVRFIEWLAIYG